MNYHIPEIEVVRERLSPLTERELRGLALKSSVPFSTLMKIRCGYTPNPGVETVRKFFSLIPPNQPKAIVRRVRRGDGTK